MKEDGIEGSRLPRFIGTLWAIWKTRNGQVFREIRATEEVFQLHIRDSHHQHTRFTEDEHPRRTPPPAPNYGPPPGFCSVNLGRSQGVPPNILIKIDGAWDKSTGYGGAAWVAMHHQRPFQSQGRFLYASSALQTEAAACLSAVKWIRTMNLTNILILTDSTLLVSFLGSTTREDISLIHTLHAICAEAGDMPSCRLIKVSRDQVQLAHQLAIHCRRNRTTLQEYC